ncbi:Hsp70 family protein, partial [Dehalococcoidia bacterium]|nr:Hsp70 family protein [Dehalococcoidia bacterium]
AEEDAQKRHEVEVRNMAENTAYSAEKLVKDNEDKIPDELKSEVETKIAALRSALDGENITIIETASAELQTSLQAVGQAVYSQSTQDQEAAGQEGEAPSNTPDAEASSESDNEDTVEGEFREV